jgi:hypothetical protein
VWLAGCSAVDEPGTGCLVHPGPTLHAAVASLVGHLLATLALEPTARGEAPQPPATARTTGTLSPPAQVAYFEICYYGDETTDLHFVGASASTRHFAPAPRRPHEGWRAFADEPGKPGWMANYSASPHATIQFLVRGSARAGTLVIEYLRSHDVQAMGRAKLWLDGHAERAVTLEGTWTSYGSQADVAVVPLRTLLADGATGPPSRNVSQHTLSFELLPAPAPASLGKFKIMDVRVCENQRNGELLSHSEELSYGQDSGALQNQPVR